MDLPPDKAKLLKQYDDEKKWDIICDQVTEFYHFFTWQMLAYFTIWLVKCLYGYYSEKLGENKLRRLDMLIIKLFTCNDQFRLIISIRTQSQMLSLTDNEKIPTCLVLNYWHSRNKLFHVEGMGLYIRSLCKTKFHILAGSYIALVMPYNHTLNIDFRSSPYHCSTLCAKETWAEF